ncbi:hypothetical protein GF312_22160 [Candidatus Poribacteria bacterium]|nr:hypothetical protein [Candidatus Poribacteria bacterium]
MKFILTVLSFALIAFPVLSGDLMVTFDDATIGQGPGDGDWVVYDEDDLGDPGPSSWEVLDSPIDGPAMSQSSNIWGDATDTVAIGSFVVYDLEEWTDFILEVDVVANDNDGMGLVWRWEDINNHYRYITMIDPGNSPNGRRGPYRLLERRLGDDGGDELPFYETLDESDESYVQGQPQNWRLEATGNSFSFYVDDKLTLEATDNAYETGKVGFLVYAQSGIFFDNLVITDTWAVDANRKLASSWGHMKNY